MQRRLACAIWLFLAAIVLAACGAPGQGPRTWLDRPLDGAMLELGPTTVQAHASDEDGVSSFEFFVDDVLLGTVPAGGSLLEEGTAGWTPAEPGTYTIRARGIDTQGNSGSEASSVVTVGGEGPGLVLTPPGATATLEVPTVGPPTESPMDEATIAPTITPTTPPQAPTMTPTTPPPPTSTPTTPPPPTIVSFRADPGSIQEGECTTLSLAVEGFISEVWLDGEGVRDHDSRDRCPSETTTYTLRARGPGGEVSQSLTVSVISDDEGPNIDNVGQSESYIYCLIDPSEVEISARVRDPSGVGSVELYCTLDGGGEEYCGALSRNGNNWSVTYIPLEHSLCLGTMEYRIRATDGSARGNVSWWGTGSFGIDED